VITLSVTSKNPKKKNASENEINLKSKFNPNSNMFFSQTLKVKKTPNMNSTNQNEQFDTNIVHFGGLNQCQ